MTNPPQEPGETGPEPEETGEATSEQESAVPDAVPDSEPTEQLAPADSAESTPEAEAESESDSSDSATAESSESTESSESESDSESDAATVAAAPPADQPPTKSRKGRIAAIVLVVALVLAGGGVALYLVNRGDQTNASGDRAGSGGGASSTRTSEPSETSSDDVYDDYSDEYSTDPSDDYESESEYPEDGDYGDTSEENTPARDIDDGSVTSDDPDDVRLAYMAAYENKEFSEIVKDSCAAYQDRFGTDTQELEDALADFDVVATEDGNLDLDGNTATGRIDIELSADDDTDSRKILVKLVEERGKWRFCGEDEA